MNAWWRAANYLSVGQIYLLGLSGTADMREVIDRAGAGDEPGQLALEVYLHRLGAGVRGHDGVAGRSRRAGVHRRVGEKSAEIRARAVERVSFLGPAIDAPLNLAAELDCEISPPGAAVRVLAIRAREDLEIARQARRVMARRAA